MNHFGMSQARLTVKSPHGGEQPGRGSESPEPGLTLILKHPAPGHLGFLLLAAKCTNRGRSGSTYKLPETAKGKEIAEKTWVLAPFLPCVSWPELLVSETQFCFFSALLWHETRVPEPFVDDYKKCKHSSSPQALVIQRDRGRNMVQEQTNSCFLKGFNVPGAHRAQVFMSSLCLAAWWEAVGGRKETL